MAKAFILDGDQATGASYTIAYQVCTDNGTRVLLVARLHYLDTSPKSTRRGRSPCASTVFQWREKLPLRRLRRTEAGWPGPDLSGPPDPGSTTEKSRGFPLADDVVASSL